MSFKLNRLKNKIICGVLATFFAAGFSGFNQPVLAMFGSTFGSGVSVANVSSNPFIDVPDSEGWTLLMRSIQECNLSSVERCLAQGADLCIMPTEFKGRYTNAFEYACDIVIGTHSGEFVDGKYDKTDWKFSPEMIEDYYKIVDIIIQYSIDRNLRNRNIFLNVNRSVLEDHKIDIETVWDCHGKWTYWQLREQYPNLFGDA